MAKNKLMFLFVFLVLSSSVFAFAPQTHKIIGDLKIEPSLDQAESCTVTTNENISGVLNCSIEHVGGEDIAVIYYYSETLKLDPEGNLVKPTYYVVSRMHMAQDAIAHGGGGPVETDPIFREEQSICGDSVCNDNESPINCQIDCPFTSEAIFCFSRANCPAWAFKFLVMFFGGVFVFWYTTRKNRKTTDMYGSDTPKQETKPVIPIIEPKIKIQGGWTVPEEMSHAPTKSEVEDYYEKVL